MEPLFDTKKIKKMDLHEFIDNRINSLQSALNLRLTYEKDLIYSAILDEYLLMKVFLRKE